MTARPESRFQSGFRHTGATATREQDSSATGSVNQGPGERAASQSDLATSVLTDQRDRELRLLQQWHEQATLRIEALAPVHDPLIASMVAYHQRELDALQARLDSVEHDHERRPRIIAESPTLGIEPTESVIADSPEAGSGSGALDREKRELRSESMRLTPQSKILA